MKLVVILIKVLASAVAIVLLLCGFYLLLEGVYIGLLADEQALESYRFGAESWIREGGWHFKSRWHFFFSGFLKSLTLILPAGVMIRLVVKIGRSRAT